MTEPRKLSDIFTELVETAVNVIDTAMKDEIKDHPAFGEPTNKDNPDEEMPLVNVPEGWTKIEFTYDAVKSWKAGTLVAKIMKSRFSEKRRVIFGLWVKYSPDNHKLHPSVSWVHEDAWGIVDFTSTWYSAHHWAFKAEEHYLVYQPETS